MALHCLCLEGCLLHRKLEVEVLDALSITASLLRGDYSTAGSVMFLLTVLSAMRECGEYHITVKSGKYLEALAKADTIVFDKTGTLTRATPQVVQVVPGAGGIAACRLSGRAFPPFHGKRRCPCCQGAGHGRKALPYS